MRAISVGFGHSVGRWTLSILALMACTPAITQADIGAAADVTFPATVTVGDTNQPASLQLTNLNNASESTNTNTVCNVGDSAPCGPPDSGIVLVPACGTVTGATCDAAGADPGVLRISPTASGRVGSACTGMGFDVSVVDPAFGTVRFTPTGGATVAMTGLGTSCTIDFTFNVLKSPTLDRDATTPGFQTLQTTTHTQTTPGFSGGTLVAAPAGVSTGTTVLRAQPAIATLATPSTTAGTGSAIDTATLSGLVNAQPGATIAFRLFGPNDAMCSGTAVFAPPPVAYPVTGGPVASPAFTPTTTGMYRWIASYSGDANNLPVTGPCNAAGETTVATPLVVPPPPVVTPPPVVPPPPVERPRDRDGDGIPDATDSCPDAPNPTQPDADRDGLGEPCDNSDASPGPTLAQTAVLRVVTGSVLVRPRGSARRRRLRGAELIPFGTVVDVRTGRVRLTSAASARKGRVQTALFSRGVFLLRQTRRPPVGTDIVVRIPPGAPICGGPGAAAAVHDGEGIFTPATAAGQPDRSLIGPAKVAKKRGGISGDGPGRWHTIAANSIATTSNAAWTIDERCDGTLTRVQRGTASVLDKHTHRTQIVTAGRSYLARAPGF